MRYKFKVEVQTSATYEVGNNGDWEVETEEIDVYVRGNDFESNEDVREFYATEFAEKFNISMVAAYDILNEYDLWFEDEDLTQIVLDNYADELKEIFTEEVSEATENYYYEHNED